mmetsp:Transcript_25433/g.71321  ORF Transcript_25433/g.71321 Transcript_25433/m.71321 type:complete len:474 (+) Transcript_25433:100-1521(+)|eukprot:CAMPEP_0119126792 /NCGR_PEP_ID=MMETSP1310-20130426/5576_1 /TAXON_ID=464262 /ORGANISM="Genus nov. species nov., Strain RCC2339" /LENGTH=473 /DNA_ID=CAMNT_0007116977 /DNA_START=80 /DNA_END=1501 /DNA_ORIENTATION=-
MATEKQPYNMLLGSMGNVGHPVGGASGEDGSVTLGGIRKWTHPKTSSEFFWATYRTVRTFIRGGFSGYAVTLAYRVLYMLFRALRKRQLSYRELRECLPQWYDLRFGAFFGFIRLTPKIHNLLAVYSGAPRYPRGDARAIVTDLPLSLVAGGLAGSAFMLISDSDNYLSGASLYYLVRAGQLVVKHVWAAYGWETIPHADAAIFILSCFEIMHAWFFHSYTIPVTYRNWITRLADTDGDMLDTIKKLKTGEVRYGVYSDALMEFSKRYNVDFKRGNFRDIDMLPPDFVHPYDPHSCLGNAVRRFANGFVQSFAIYAPVHLLPTVLLGWKRLKEDPVQTLLRVFDKIMQSATFLSVFIALVWYSLCVVRHSPLRDGREYRGFLAGCFFCGFSIFIEQKSRRIELALKVLTDALISVWRRAERKGIVISLPHSDVFFFSLANGLFLYYYRHHPELIKSALHSILRLFWGYADDYE